MQGQAKERSGDAKGLHAISPRALRSRQPTMRHCRNFYITNCIAAQDTAWAFDWQASRKRLWPYSENLAYTNSVLLQAGPELSKSIQCLYNDSLFARAGLPYQPDDHQAPRRNNHDSVRWFPEDRSSCRGNRWRQNGQRCLSGPFAERVPFDCQKNAPVEIKCDPCFAGRARSGCKGKDKRSPYVE